MARRMSYLAVTYGLWHRPCKRGSDGGSVGVDECRRIDALNLGAPLCRHDLGPQSSGSCRPLCILLTAVRERPGSGSGEIGAFQDLR